jgi:hypothetical protein
MTERPRYQRTDLKVLIQPEFGNTLYEAPDGNLLVGFLTGGAFVYEVFGVFSKEEAVEYQLFDPFCLNKIGYDLVHNSEKYGARLAYVVG